MVGDVLNHVVFRNRIVDYLVCLLFILVGILAISIFRRIVLSRLRAWASRTRTTLDDFAVDVFRKSLVPLGYYGAFYLSVRTLTLSQFLDRAIEVAGIFLLTVVAIQFGVSLCRYGIDRYLASKEKDPARERALAGFSALVKVVVWGLGSVFLLDNLGFKISTVIAGLGIGGIAVALAAQSLLGDLFSYFTILFDKPFEIGDFIMVGEHSGVVEHLGVKTVRIASVNGGQIIVSNKDLTDSRVRNYKRMEKRRVVFKLGVTYQTDDKALKEIPGILTAIIEGTGGASLERVHFASYGDFSIVFEVAYFVEGNDYIRFMDVQQEINYRIYEEFARRRIEFAYPTQTVYLARAPVGDATGAS